MNIITSNVREMPFPENFLAFDTESYRYDEGNKEKHELAVGDVFDGHSHALFYDFASFKKIIYDYANDNNKKIVYVFAHNILYDIKNLDRFIVDIIKGEPFYNFKVSRKKMLDRIVWIEYSKRTKVMGRKITQKIIFLDSWNYLKNSLKQLAHDLLGDFGKYFMDDNYALPPDKWNEFIKMEGIPGVQRDTEVLYNVLKQYFNFLRNYKIPFGYSLPHSAFSFFRINYLDRDMYFPDNTDYQEKMLQAYRGGFVNAIELGTNYGTIYDINSLYPYAMKNHKLPVSYYRQLGLRKISSLDDYQYYKQKYYIIANVSFVLPDDVEISFIVKRINNKLISIKSGNVWLHEPEIDYLIKKGAAIIFQEVHLYYYSYTLFNRYVDFFYTIKQTASKLDNKAARSLSKLYLNSLYGKFGQHVAHTEYFYNEAYRSKNLRITVFENNQKKVISNYGNYQSIQVIDRPRYSPEISGAITAYGRIYLSSFFDMVSEDCVYCDTDSLFVKSGNTKLNAYLSDKLGYLKIETKNGNPALNVPINIIAPKMYSVNNTEIIKGIRKDAVKIGEREYIQKQFTSIKSSNLNNYVMSVRKKINPRNDKLKYTGNRGKSFNESDITQ